MKREALTAYERHVNQVLIDQLIWDCLPWYKKLWRTLTGRTP